MENLAKLQSGLICIVGMTGSGKSSTCAALVDWINRNRKLHILTLEDPVEYHIKGITQVSVKLKHGLGVC